MLSAMLLVVVIAMMLICGMAVQRPGVGVEALVWAPNPVSISTIQWACLSLFPSDEKKLGVCT